jgi:hypothetical protein
VHVHDLQRVRARFALSGTLYHAVEACQEQNELARLAESSRRLERLGQEKFTLSYSSNRDEICLDEGWRIVEYACTHTLCLPR